jgi:hypothetical protein
VACERFFTDAETIPVTVSKTVMIRIRETISISVTGFGRGHDLGPSSGGSNEVLLGVIGELSDFPFAITNRTQTAK